MFFFFFGGGGGGGGGVTPCPHKKFQKDLIITFGVITNTTKQTNRQKAYPKAIYPWLK